jgi:CubicO group peptidase (beta-lactamase class C family)
MSHLTPGRISRRSVLTASLAAGTLAATAPLLNRSSLSVLAAPATPAAARDPDALFQELSDLVTRRMAELQVPGVAVGVIAGGQEYTAGFGVTNLDHPLPVDAGTLFQIGSTGKTFTATAIMRLVEQGKLDLEAPVRTYLPDFRVADEQVSQDVRLRHLVTHTAGWFGDFIIETGDGDDALAKYVARMADLRQIAPLGTYFSYNNAAFVLAGRVVEVVTEQPFETAIGEMVLQPLGLEETFLFPEEIMTKAFASGHTPPEDDPECAPIVAEPWALPRSGYPAGGEISSVSDQLRYARFHMGDGTVNGTRVLSADALAQMQRPLGPGAGHGPFVLDGVGVSWLLTTIGGERVVMHGGSTNGQQSSFLLVPERDFAITVLTNADAGAVLAEETTMWALEHYHGLTIPAPEPIAVAPEQMLEYVADYDFGSEMLVSVGEENGGLALTLTEHGEPIPGGSGPLPMVGTDRGAFDFDGITFLTDFLRDDAGKVGWIRFSGRMGPRLD